MLNPGQTWGMFAGSVRSNHFSKASSHGSDNHTMTWSLPLKSQSSVRPQGRRTLLETSVQTSQGPSHSAAQQQPLVPILQTQDSQPTLQETWDSKPKGEDASWLHSKSGPQCLGTGLLDRRRYGTGMQKARVEAREYESSEVSLVDLGAGWRPGTEFL